VLSNDDKSHRCPHRQRAAQLSIELSRNPDELALAVQTASANQDEHAGTGRLWTRLPRGRTAPYSAEQQEMLTGLVVVLGLGVLVFAVLEANA
jgi:hypothetical protein